MSNFLKDNYLIKLGYHDLNKKPLDIKKFLKPLHGLDFEKDLTEFKDEDRIDLKEIDGKKKVIRKTLGFVPTEGNEVTELQMFLFDSGFMPRANDEYAFNGVFDYATQASVRLFQEYVRSIEGKNVKPDGIIGNNSKKHIIRWKQNNIKADWIDISSKNPTDEYTKWIELLNKAKEHYLTKLTQNEVLKKIETHLTTHKSATRKVFEWDFKTSDIHLIGIRRNESLSAEIRLNDDLFVLLIHGMVFKFWGSTDPNARMANRKDEPFLVEGQHKYRFGWHRGTYRALRPYAPGVLVFRDKFDDNALTIEAIDQADLSNNMGINIHWSGIGSYNFSAGCQVIAGASYMNHHGEVISCSEFAATNKRNFVKSEGKTKGAYNMLADLVVCFSDAPKSKKKPNFMYYTLGREESLDLDSNFGSAYAKEILEKLIPKKYNINL